MAYIPTAQIPPDQQKIQDSVPVQPSVQPNTPMPTSQNNSTLGVLSGLSTGDFGGIQKVIKFVKEGKKLDNRAMVELLKNLKQQKGLDYKELLSIYLTLDKAVEDGVLNEELIEYLKNKPQEIID